ncbi:hypothetical protein ACU70A_06275 [Syntrophomonas erecta subsp. sporosyntropha]
MSPTEVIQSQINLLADLNRELASQATPEAAREVRENIQCMVELAGLRAQSIVIDDLEERLGEVEKMLFGPYLPEAFEFKYSLAQFVIDCREDIDTIYDIWGRALDRHLGEDWCEEDDDEAGD